MSLQTRQMIIEFKIFIQLELNTNLLTNQTTNEMKILDLKRLQFCTCNLTDAACWRRCGKARFPQWCT